MHTFAHIEIPTTDLARASEFYGKLFQWKLETFATDDYKLIITDDGGAIGGLSLLDKLPEMSGFYNYVEVHSIDASLARAAELGGKMYRPKTELPPGFGFYAILEAPDGYKFGIWARGA
jgi:uncharacterized protein